MYSFIHVPKTAGLSLMKIIGDNRQVLRYVGHQRALNVTRPNKFSIVRNPYDRIVSAYFYLIQGGTGEEPDTDYQKQLRAYKDFKDFVFHIGPDGLFINIIHLRPMTYYLCDNKNNVIVKRIYRFEDMGAIDLFLRRIGVRARLSDTVVSPSRHEHYTSYLDADIKAEIYRVYGNDFKLFGYSL